MNGIMLSVCMVAIATAIFRIAAPENTFKKQIALLISCFFILSIVNCFSKGGISIDTELYDNLEMQSYVDFSGKINSKAQKEIASELSKKINEILAEQNVFPDRIHIIINIRGTYSIDISEVKLVFNEEASEEEKNLAYELTNDAVEGTIPITITTE